MLFSTQQKAIIELMRKMKYLRQDQLYALLERLYPDMGWTQHRFDSMMDQLVRIHGSIRRKDNLVLVGRSIPQKIYLEAVDVMLAISQDAKLSLLPKKNEDVILYFTINSEDKIRFFSIVPYSVEIAHAQYPSATERVVFLANADVIPSNSTLPYRHFFAVKHEDGSHRFYAGHDE